MSDAHTVPLNNWGGNVRYAAKRIHRPTTVAEVSRLVRTCDKPRALGTRHSFNRVADTEGDLISTAAMNRVLSLDATAGTVTIEPGVTYGALGAYLHARGLALANVPSLPHVCVAGAVATGTHGSGTANLSSAVEGMQLVTADGAVRAFSRERDRETFNGMVVALGLLGIVTQLTLRVRPSFDVQQDVYERVPLAGLIAAYDVVLGSAYSASLFTLWRDDQMCDVWLKRDVTAGAAPANALVDVLNGRRATGPRHPIPGAPPEHCTPHGVPGPWHERLPHFRADREPSSAGDELQSEYFVSRADAPAALTAVAGVGERLADQLLISEVRSVDADRLWLSPCYDRSSIAIHFTWHPREPEVTRLLTEVLEPALAPFEPRPHWGKLFATKPGTLRARYRNLPAFIDLCDHVDPEGVFRNAFTDQMLFR